MIPNKIHWIWTGPPMPDWVVQNKEEFQRLNPNYEMMCHGKEVLLPEYEHAYAQLGGLDSRADLLALSAIRRYGGWYFDTDFVPFRPIDEIVADWELDGSRMFITEQHGQRAKELKMANAVIAAESNAPAWAEIDRFIAETQPPYTRCRFGPELFTTLQGRYPHLFTVGGWPWFYPCEIGRALDVYARLNEHNRAGLASLAPTGGQVPFMLHLWAGGMTDLRLKTRPTSTTFAQLSGAANGPFYGRRACLAILKIQWDDATQCFQSVASGLAALGFDVSVLQVSDELNIDLVDLVVTWNGRKGVYLNATGQAQRRGIPAISIEHGFLGNRRANVHMDHHGILHWASWANDWAGDPPDDSEERLERVRLPEMEDRKRQDGYVLVLGQLDGDSQLDESDPKVARMLQRLVRRAMPSGIPIRFRPHPDMRKFIGRREIELCSVGSSLEDAVRGARFAVMINSNSANECLMWGCPVLCFGPALYANAGCALQTTPAKIGADLARMASGWHPSPEKVERYLRHLVCRQYGFDEMASGAALMGPVSRALNTTAASNGVNARAAGTPQVELKPLPAGALPLERRI